MAERGQRWQAIGAALARMPEACRDRFRETRLGAARRSGKWAPEEEARLADIVPAALAAAQVRAAVRCTGSRRLAIWGLHQLPPSRCDCRRGGVPGYEKRFLAGECVAQEASAPELWEVRAQSHSLHSRMQDASAAGLREGGRQGTQRDGRMVLDDVGLWY